MAHERVIVSVEGADPGLDRAILERARRRGFSKFVLRTSTPPTAGLGEELYVRHPDRLEPVAGSAEPVPIRAVAGPDDLDRSLALVAARGPVVLTFAHDRLIPLENAVAARGRDAPVWVFVDRPESIPGALGALEHGAARVIVPVRSIEAVDAVEAFLDAAPGASLEWRTLGLTAVRPAGVGDRVLVDTTSLLRPEEGLLVGSVAAFLFHVASEAVGSAFSRPRPFRVNAGAAHSYVLMADGTTRYLSELSAGDRVLAAVPKGETRPVRVGRVKIERRPLVVLEANDDGRPRTVFLQEAETVRVSTDAGRRATTEIGLPARVLGVGLPTARHLGRAVEETIVER